MKQYELQNPIKTTDIDKKLQNQLIFRNVNKKLYYICFFAKSCKYWIVCFYFFPNDQFVV